MNACEEEPGLNGAAAEQTGGSGSSILVVEDEFLVANYICSVLEDAGYPVAGTAANAAEAVAIAAAKRPSLALLDIRRAGGDDGVVLAGHLRNLLPDLPVVFVSGSGDPATRARIAATAPSGFLQKPVSPEALLNAIRSALTP
jgi:two-component system, response regulator PdtaR